MKNIIYYISLLLIISLRFIWIGDSSFINDEPLFILKALKSNSIGEWFTLGLVGKMGVAYGPVSMLYFKSLLGISHNIFSIYLMNTFIVTAVTLAGVYLLFIKSLKYNKWVVPIIMLSPYFWFYSRNLWDNSLNIPLSILALGSFSAFLKFRNVVFVYIFTISLSLMFQIHLMSLAYIIPMICYFFILERKWILNNSVQSVLIFICNTLILFPYLSYLFSAERISSTQAIGGFRSIVFPFLSGRFFTAFDFSYFLGKGWQNTFGPDGIGYLLGLFMVLSWIGFIIYFFSLFRGGRMIKSHTASIEKTLFIISFSTLFLHLVMAVVGRLYTHPHYYNGVISITVFIIGYGVNYILDNKRSIALIYSVSLFACLIGIMVNVHINGGSRKVHYGHTLKDLNKAALLISKSPQSVSIIRNTFHTKTFPHAIEALVLLLEKENIDSGNSIVELNYLNKETNKLKVITR